MNEQKLSLLLKRNLDSAALKLCKELQKTAVKMSAMSAIRLAVKSADRYLTETPEIRDLVAEIAKAAGLDVSPETAVEYAARRTRVSAPPLPKDNLVALHSYYGLAVRHCLGFMRDIIGSVIACHPDILPEEKLIAEICNEMAPFFDTIFLKWWKRHVILMRESPLGKEGLKSRLKELGKTNAYSVFSIGKDPQASIGYPLDEKILSQCEEIPLVAAFRREIDRISKILKGAVRRLPKDWEDYAKYFSALRLALDNADLDRMEELWLEVDEKFASIGADRRLIPVHMMEDGYHDPFRVSPELRLMWRTSDYGYELGVMRDAMKKFGMAVDGEAGAKIDRTDIGVFLTVVDSGFGIDFRSAGQSVPNRPEAQETGIKVFLASESLDVRLNGLLAAAKKAFDDLSFSWIKRYLTMEFQYLLIFGHELGHPICVTRELVDAFGEDKPKVEEAKATLFGVAGVELAIKDGKLGDSLEACNCLIAQLMCEIARRMNGDTFDDPTLSPYSNECMALLNTLAGAAFGTPLLSVGEDGKWSLDTRPKTVMDAVEKLRKIPTVVLAEIYCGAKKGLLLKFVENFCNKGHSAIKAFRKILK